MLRSLPDRAAGARRRTCPLVCRSSDGHPRLPPQHRAPVPKTMGSAHQVETYSTQRRALCDYKVAENSITLVTCSVSTHFVQKQINMQLYIMR